MSNVKDSIFLKNLRGEPCDRTPIWIMRQAGRYLPEYQEVRSKLSFTELCQTPEAACEVTLQPIRRFGFDAAIVFSDILTPLVPAGIELAFSPAPHIANPIREPADLDRPNLRAMMEAELDLWHPDGPDPSEVNW